MAKPYKRGNVWWVGITINGLQKCLSLKTQNYQEALKRAKEIDQQYKGIQLSELLNKWLVSVEYKSDRYKNDGIVYMNQFIEWFGDKSAGLVTKQDIQDYYNQYLKKDKAYADNTIGIRLRTIKTILNYGYKNDLIPSEPFRGFKIPTTQPKIEYLSEGEVDDLLELAGQNNPLYQSYIEILVYWLSDGRVEQLEVGRCQFRFEIHRI
jgi:site-specific recombinase XerD